MAGRCHNFWAVFTTVTLLSALTGCGETGAETKPKDEGAIPAATVTVHAASQNEVITSAGTVRLRRETALGFTTSGQVASVRYEKGDRVNRGAILAALDKTTVSADLDSAQAELDRSAAEFGRIQSLYTDGWITKARLEQAESAMLSAKARVNASGFASRTAQIRAPGNGIILSRDIDAGQIVNAGQPVMVLGETDKGFVLKVPLTDVDASRVRVGMRAKVSVPAISTEPIDAVVSEMGGRADERTGTFEVSFLLPANDRLLSGQIGSVDIEVSRNHNGSVAVPATAIFGVRSGEGLVFVVDGNNRVKPRNIVIGKLADDSLEITSGLKAGEIIVSRGIEKLHDGDRIKPVRQAK